jgi:hypothetical protein
LSDGKPTGPEPKGGVMLSTGNIIVAMFEGQNKAQVPEHEHDNAHRWYLEPEGASNRGYLRI